jgi:hypothetical protein
MEKPNDNINRVYRDAINVLYRHIQYREKLVSLVHDIEVIRAIQVLRTLPIDVLDRLADPNSG